MRPVSSLDAFKSEPNAGKHAETAPKPAYGGWPGAAGKCIPQVQIGGLTVHCLLEMQHASRN